MSYPPELGIYPPELGMTTLPETNIFAPENRPKPTRKVIFQPSIFRGYVSFREGIWSSHALFLLDRFFLV